MFALLYYLSLNADVAIIDEPTNRLHHAWIEKVLEELSSRQSFVATQSPLWIDYLAFQSAKDVRETFIQCTNVPVTGGGHTWRWASLGEDDARRFFAAYEQGVQYVSEILMAKGLW